MGFSVTKLTQELVVPCAPAPDGTLPLSWLDRYPTQRALIGSLHVFKHGRGVARVIRDALAKALVPYYPLAGRMVESDRGELEVDCNGDGVWFIEASANCSLEDINHLEHPFMISEGELLPYPQPQLQHFEEEQLMFMFQVTEFTGGGFVIGIRSNHGIADGPGAAQFVTAISELARGLTNPTVNPIWRRESIPTPPKFTTAPPPSPSADFHLHYIMVDVPPDHISHMKRQYLSQTGHRCSAFEVLIAKAWKIRIQSIELANNDDQVHLCFAMNTRKLLKHAMGGEEGYYGNCYYLMKVTATRGRIANSSIVEIVRLIKDGKKRLPVEYSKWAKGELKEDPYGLTTGYDTLLVSDWTWLGFNEVDFGWGSPMHVVPLTNSDCVATCILVKPSAPKGGARLITQCVKREHLQDFLDGMMKLE